MHEPERKQTAALTTFTVAMLADNPHVFTRLRNEVLNTLGPYGKVTAENLRMMKYLRAVLNGKWIVCLLRLKWNYTDDDLRDVAVIPQCVSPCDM